MVRDWAAGSGATEAVRDIEQGEPKAWQPVFEGLAGLGLFGVAVPEDCGGAGGSIEDLCAMVEEAARALVPGPVATTALATLVVSDPALREALASGERTAGVALDSDVEFDETTSQVSGHRAVGARRRRRRTAVGAGRRDVAAHRLGAADAAGGRRAAAGHRLLPAAGAGGAHLGSGQRDRRSARVG